MNMSDIRRIVIDSGLERVAYDFDFDTGTLWVWLGAFTVDAPETAIHVEVPYHEAWSMERADESDE